MNKKFFRKKIAGLVSLLAVGSAQAAQVDLLVIYDKAAETRFNGNVQAALTSWVDNANEAYNASKVDIQLRLVGVEKYTPSSPNDMEKQLEEIRYSDEVARIRKKYGADFVTLLTSRDGSTCGIGYVVLRSSFAFNVTGAECGYLTLVHELGHNMGLHHSRRQGDDGGTRYGYGLGYGVDNEFSTIMAYPHVFGTYRRVNQFSDPNVQCRGFTCGVPIGQREESDSHTALNNVKMELADFVDTVVGPGTATPPPVSNPTPPPVSNPTPPPVSNPTPPPVSNPTPPPSGGAVLPPSNLTALASQNNTVELNWRDNSTNESRFIIQRSSNSNSGFVTVGRVPAEVTEFTDSDSQIAAGQTYFYRVRARNSTASSDWSNIGMVAIPGSGSGGSGGTDFTAMPPRSDGSGLNLLGLGFRGFPTKVGRNAVAYAMDSGKTAGLENHVWIRTRYTFDIAPGTMLEFDYSANSTGEISGIGFDDNGIAEQDDIFKLSGSEAWGNADYTYTGAGKPQHFSIPIGNYFSGSKRLVLVNDNDQGSGNISYFSNIRIYNPAADLRDGVNTSVISFGLSPIDESKAMLYYEASQGGAGDKATLCIGNDCATSSFVNGRYQRVVNVELGQQYWIEYRNGSCSVSAVVKSSSSASGVNSSACP